MFDLADKVVLFAGGAGYLGLPACKGLAEQGARVAVADINPAGMAAAVKEIAGVSSEDRVTGIHLDVGDEASIHTAVERTLGRFGRLDVLVNAAYWSTAKGLEDLTAEEFDRANRVNITGAFLLVRAAAQSMREGGSIILYASMYGLVAPDPAVYHAPMPPNPIEYGAGKAALMQMVRYLAAHYGAKNIRVNAVCPGPFPTPETQAQSPEFIERLAGKNPLGRMGRRDETAGAIVFLASDESSYVTGHVLRVDGGWTAW